VAPCSSCAPPCRLNRVVMEVATERSQRFLDRTFEVLVEGVNPKDPKQVGAVKSLKQAWMGAVVVVG